MPVSGALLNAFDTLTQERQNLALSTILTVYVSTLMS